MQTLLVVAFCWIFYGSLHSLLLHIPIRERIKEIVQIDDQTYRLVYALISISSLFIATLITLLSNGHWVKEPDWITYSGGGILVVGSLYLLRQSFQSYNLMVFIGLQPETHQKLHIGGMNRYVRHPLYLSTVLLLIGIMVFWPTDVILTACTVMIVYTFIGAKLEEQKLVARFGKDYIDYMQEVPGFIPKWKD